MARIPHRDIGDVWEPQATFSVSGTPTDPTNVTVRYMEPDGTITVLGPVAGGTGGGGITRVSAGVFKISVTLDAAGYWFARFEGTGAATAAEDHQLIVDPSLFYDNAGLDDRALVGLAETKDWLQTLNIETAEDLEIVDVINDISDRFHEEAEREFKLMNATSDPNPQTRIFPVEYVSPFEYWYIDGDLAGVRDITSRRVQVGDMSAVTTVEILDTDWTTVLETVAAADYTLHPTVRAAWEPITEIELHSTVTALQPNMRVRVTGDYGFPAVPGNVRRAVLDAVAETLDRDVEHYRQDVGAVPTAEAGNVIVFGRTGARPVSLPPRSMAVARSYRTRSPVT